MIQVLDAFHPCRWIILIETGLASDRREKISSIGAGLLWNPAHAFNAQLDYGHAVNKGPGKVDDLHDKGWHFSFAYQF